MALERVDEIFGGRRAMHEQALLLARDRLYAFRRAEMFGDRRLRSVEARAWVSRRDHLHVKYKNDVFPHYGDERK
jgi:hypothetical protein